MITLLRHHPSAPLLPRILVAALLVSATGTVAAERLDVGQFSRGILDHWEAEVFSGITEYHLEADAERGTVLGAQSQGAASGLFRKIDIDLNATPWLHWSWKVDNLLQGADERTKAGDDYPARIYVVFSGNMFFWKTRALNYVWSSHQVTGSEWPNAYTGNARMIAVQSADTAPGQWRSETRDVRADYRRLFGEEPGPVAAVAIMTDTDNTGQSTKAWYGDIWFSESATKTLSK